MKNFNYYQPTEILFGVGRIKEIGKAVSKYGNRCLLVTGSKTPKYESMFKVLKDSLNSSGVELAHFDGVIPNPTTDVITNGANMAKEFNANVILGFGGGSSMDSAKAIAVEATHEGTSWDYLFYRDTQPSEKTLPVITVSTTSGTGAHVTQVAVITNENDRDKSAIYNNNVIPKVSIVDPELMLSVPQNVTSATGFDVFCHAFESTLHPNSSLYTELMAFEAIDLVIRNLKNLVDDGSNLESRKALAWADTLAGLCITNAGVTLPHGIGMAIGGMYPQVMHGEALALNYPEFSRFTYQYAIPQFSRLGRLFNKDLNKASDMDAAKECCNEIDKFLKEIKMWFGLTDFNIPKEELNLLAKQSQVLPDYEQNPIIANLEQMTELLSKCYER